MDYKSSLQAIHMIVFNPNDLTMSYLQISLPITTNQLTSVAFNYQLYYSPAAVFLKTQLTETITNPIYLNLYQVILAGAEYNFPGQNPQKFQSNNSKQKYYAATITSTLSIETDCQETKKSLNYYLYSLSAQLSFNSNFIWYDQGQNSVKLDSYHSYDLDLSKSKPNLYCNNIYTPVTFSLTQFPDQILYQNYLEKLTCPFEPSVTNPLCSDTNILYSVDESSIPSKSQIVTVDSLTNQIQLQITDTSVKTGSYQISITQTLPSGVSSIFSFKLTIVSGTSVPKCSIIQCYQSISTIKIDSSIIQDQQYTIGDSKFSFVFPQFSQNSPFCKTSDIYYTYTINPSPNTPNFITWNQNSNNNTITWGSNTNLDQGNYQITVTGSITDAKGTFVISTSFKLVVNPSCYGSIATIKALSQISNQTYKMGSLGVTKMLDFSQDSTYCSQSDIKITIQNSLTFSYLKPYPQIYGNFIELDSIGKQISWYTNSYLDVGTYKITIISSINTTSNNSPVSYSFNLDVTSTCIFSVPAIQIKPVEQFKDSNYFIGDTKDSQNIANFTQDSSACSVQDISYSLSIIPNLTNTSNIIINYSQDSNGLNIVTWYSTKYDEAQYLITLTGKIINNFTNNMVDVVTNSASSQFYLNILKPPCSSQTETLTIKPKSQIQNQTYFVEDPSTSIQIENFTVDSLSGFCESKDIFYEISISPQYEGQGFIDFYPANTSQKMKVVWNTTNNNYAGSYQITITGSIISYTVPNKTSEKLDFQLNVISSCLSPRTQIIAQFSNIIYTIGDPLQQTFLNVTDTAQGTCWQQWTYEIYIISKNKPVLVPTIESSPIYFSPQVSNLQLNVYSVNPFNEVINLQLVALKYGNWSTSIDFTVTLSLPVCSQPYFEKIGLKNLTLDFDNITDYIGLKGQNFGPIIDAQAQDTVYLQAVKFPVIAKSLFNYTYENSSNSFFLTFNATTVLNSVMQNTRFTIFVILRDQSEIIPCNTTYVINFNVPAGFGNQTNITQNQTSKELKKKQNNESSSILIPYWSSIKTSYDGTVKISFSEDFIVPSNLSAIDKSKLALKIIPANTSLSANLNFSWTVKDFSKRYFTIQLKFQNPQFVSSKGKFNLDKIEVVCFNTTYFLSQNSNLQIMNNTKLVTTLPAQLGNNQKLNDALNLLTSGMYLESIAMLITSFTMSIFMSVGMVFLWGMINSLQIISNLPLFNIYMPANAFVFYQCITDLSSFKIIPTDWILENIFPFLIDPDSLSVFQSLGAFFTIYLIGIGALLTLIIVVIMRKKITKRFAVIEYLYTNLINRLFWDNSSRYILESYLQFSLVSLQTFYDGVSWIGVQGSGVVFTIFTFAIIIIAPLIMTIYLSKQTKNFKLKSFQQKFGSVTSNLNFRSKSSPNYLTIFCYRRLIFAILIVLAVYYPYAQLIFMTITSILVVMCFGASNPLEIPQERRMEYFNEATILLCLYHFYLFTDFVDDPVAQYTMGYSLIGFTLLNFIGNILVAFYNISKQLLTQLKRLWYKFKVYQIKKAQRLKQKMLDKQKDLNLYQQELIKNQLRVFFKEQKQKQEKLSRNSTEILQNKVNEAINLKISNESQIKKNYNKTSKQKVKLRDRIIVNHPQLMSIEELSEIESEVEIKVNEKETMQLYDPITNDDIFQQILEFKPYNQKFIERVEQLEIKEVSMDEIPKPANYQNQITVPKQQLSQLKSDKDQDIQTKNIVQDQIQLKQSVQQQLFNFTKPSKIQQIATDLKNDLQNNLSNLAEQSEQKVENEVDLNFQANSQSIDKEKQIEQTKEVKPEDSYQMTGMRNIIADLQNSIEEHNKEIESYRTAQRISNYSYNRKL